MEIGYLLGQIATVINLATELIDRAVFYIQSCRILSGIQKPSYAF
jgi:hypothetical protein